MSAPSATSGSRTLADKANSYCTSIKCKLSTFFSARMNRPTPTSPVAIDFLTCLKKCNCTWSKRIYLLIQAVAWTFLTISMAGISTLREWCRSTNHRLNSSAKSAARSASPTKHSCNTFKRSTRLACLTMLLHDNHIPPISPCWKRTTWRTFKLKPIEEEAANPDFDSKIYTLMHDTKIGKVCTKWNLNNQNVSKGLVHVISLLRNKAICCRTKSYWRHSLVAFAGKVLTIWTNWTNTKQNQVIYKVASVKSAANRLRRTKIWLIIKIALDICLPFTFLPKSTKMKRQSSKKKSLWSLRKQISRSRIGANVRDPKMLRKILSSKSPKQTETRREKTLLP